MLHENAKQRLWRLIPTEYEMEWFDPLANTYVSDTVTLDRATQIRWARQGRASTYPCVYLDVSPQGTPRGDIGHMFEDGIYKEDHADPEIAYTKYTAAPQTSRLVITVDAKQGTELIPKRIVADEIAIDVWHAFRFDSDHLDTPGVTPTGQDLDYSWPLSVRETSVGMQDTSRQVDEQAIERRQFEFDVQYAYFKSEEVPATDSIIWRFGVDKDFDGEVDDDDWTDWQQTPGYSGDSVIDDVEQYMQDKLDGLHD